MWRREYIISAVIMGADNTICVIFVPLTKRRGNLSAKDVIGDQKENAQDTQRNFLKLVRKGASRAKFARFGAGEAVNGLDQTRKDDRVKSRT